VKSNVCSYCDTYTKQGVLFFSLVATIGSLYLSLGMGLLPCQLCWYQRILMYPIVPIIVYSIVRDTQLFELTLFFSTIGISIASYHSYIQRVSVESACSNFCASILYQVGPFTIPNLALIAFLGIFVISKYEVFFKNRN